MIYLLYIIISILFATIQTVFFSSFPVFASVYDLGIGLVLYTGLNRPTGDGVCAVLAMGVFMDTLSGAPFGLYLTSYIWFYALIRVVILFLRPTSIILFGIAMTVGIGLQNILLLIPVIAAGGVANALRSAWPHVGYQVGWGMLTGMYLMMGLDFLVKAWSRIADSLFGSRNNASQRLS